MRIYVNQGILVEITAERVISVTEADTIARRNGFSYAEQFVKGHSEGRVLNLDENLKVEGSP